ncbi:MAG: 1-acyl-sn-glycerol-3-phosphate acyltransferase [Bacteroidales bacterium]|nr:1-acyl-sn-glycerol-3-phosphate acyltransferase [Bacteroidales bacterium]
MALIPIEELEKAIPLFRGKAGNAFARFLLRLINVDDIEKLNDRLSMHEGAEFARAVNEAVGISYTVDGIPREEALEHFRDKLPEGPFITISNHPIGSLDGLMLIDFIGHLRDDYKFMVNEILARFESLRPSLISVTPNGNILAPPTARSIAGVREAKLHLEAGGCLGLFPAGAVSDLKLGRCPENEPRVRDREWQTSIIKFIRNAGVPVLPIRLLDGNSAFYYNLGLIDWRVRLLRLPTEMLNKAGKTLRLVTGPIITPTQISALPDLETLRHYLRASVYSLQ